MSTSGLGQGLDQITRLQDEGIHAVCIDPPYSLVEFSAKEMTKPRAGRGGIWRLPPSWDGCDRRPLPRDRVWWAWNFEG